MDDIVVERKGFDWSPILFYLLLQVVLRVLLISLNNWLFYDVVDDGTEKVWNSGFLNGLTGFDIERSWCVDVSFYSEVVNECELFDVSDELIESLQLLRSSGL